VQQQTKIYLTKLTQSKNTQKTHKQA